MGMFDFNANDPTSYEAMQLRQRLALQLMGNSKKGYPKNVGEGLTAIGDAIGDVGTMRRLEAMQARADQAAAVRAGAVRAAPAATAPPPAQTDPSSRSEAPDTSGVQTADAAPAAASAVPGLLMAAANNDAYQPADALPPVQDAGGAPQMASADTGTVSDAPPVGAPTGTPNPDAVRNSLAQLIQSRQGVPQPNPMLGGSSPATLPSTSALDPAYLGSPDRSADNRPITVQLAGPPEGIKPSGAPSERVPAPEAQPRWQAAPQFQKPPVFSDAPPVPDKSPQQVAAERELLNPMNSPSDRQRMQDIIGIEQKRREDAHKTLMDAWNVKKALTESEYQKERDRQRDAAKIESEQQEREQKKQQADYAERIQRHLGGRNPTAIEENLYKSRASVANIPAITQSLQRVNAVVDKMYTGPTADVNTFLSQLLPTFPGGFDPAKGTATQQFRTAMTDIMAAHRAAVVGPGSQSGPELALLQKSTASDAKLNIDTIKESLQAAERLMVKTAIAHQQEVHNYAGNFDADRTRSVFGSFGVPGMIDVVPQRTVGKLMQHANDDNAKKDFDETYHTPGLADRLIQRELLRQGTRR